MFKITLSPENVKVLKDLASFTYGAKEKNMAHLRCVNVKVTKYNKIVASVLTKTQDFIEVEFNPVALEGTRNIINFNMAVDDLKALSAAKTAPDIEIILDGHTHFAIKSGSAEIRYAFHGDEFPKAPKIKSADTLFAIRPDNFETLRLGAISTLKSESRPVLMHTQVKDSGFVSTDSHRLYGGKVIGQVLDGAEFLLSDNFFKYVSKLEDTKKLFGVLKQINDHSEMLLFETLQANYYVRQSAGNFPDTKRLIPDSFSYEYELLEVPLFLQGIKEALKVVKGDTNNPIRLEFEKDKLNLTATSGDSEFKMTYKVTPLDKGAKNETFKISASGVYLTEALQQVRATDKACFRFMGSMRPFIIDAKYVTEDVFALVLPVRTY